MMHTSKDEQYPDFIISVHKSAKNNIRDSIKKTIFKQLFSKWKNGLIYQYAYIYYKLFIFDRN